MISIEGLFETAFKAACKALDETVETIYTESTEQHCPIKEGTLKASAKNELAVDTNEEHTREISYNTPYAVYVHEIIRYHHGNKSAKFLEIPAEYHKVHLITNIKNAVRDALEH